MPRTSGFTEAELAAFEWSKNQKRVEKPQYRKGYGSRRRSFSETSQSDSDSSADYAAIRGSRHRHERGGRRYRSRSRSGGHMRSKTRRRQSRSSSRSHERDYRNRYSSSRSSSRGSRSRGHRLFSRYRSTSSSTPRDPYNPLKLAHRMDRGNVRGRRQGNSDRDRRSPERSQDERYTESHVEKDDGKWKHDLYESDGERAAYEADLRAQKQNTGYVVDTRKGAWRSRAGGVYLSPKEEVDEDLYENRKRSSGRSSPSYGRD